MLTSEYEALLDDFSLNALLFEHEETLSWLSGVPVPQGDAEQDEQGYMTKEDWNQNLLPSSWQSVQKKAISLRCYNLCIGANATHFSGWEKDEFCVDLMKTGSSGSSYFGVRIHDGKVAGVLPAAVEDELVYQWDIMTELFPETRSFGFKGRLRSTKDQSWYQDTKQQRLNMLEREKIANDGEIDGLTIFLSYSRASLLAAKSPNLNSKERLRLLSSSLSVLLPMVSNSCYFCLILPPSNRLTVHLHLCVNLLAVVQTQFCLDQKIWDSAIGKAAAESGGDGAERSRQLAAKKDATPKVKPQPLRKRSRQSKMSYKSLDDRFEGEEYEIFLSNAVPIPASELKRVWNISKGLDDNIINNNGPSKEAQEAMQRVHEAMQLLRACYSEESVQKASLQVAMTMLDLVAEEDCENPFVCLQQAAIFASHAPKGGTSDAFFRECLPKASDCTPQDALVILGRADCFQAVFFPYEAAFLCSYVARVCNAHRTGTAAHSEAVPGLWNDQWKIIGILCYNVSTMIRATVKQVLRSEIKKEDIEPWDGDVVDELMEGRADALDWQSKLKKKETSCRFINGVANQQPDQNSVSLRMPRTTASVSHHQLPNLKTPPTTTTAMENSVRNDTMEQTVIENVVEDTTPPPPPSALSVAPMELEDFDESTAIVGMGTTSYDDEFNDIHQVAV